MNKVNEIIKMAEKIVPHYKGGIWLAGNHLTIYKAFRICDAFEAFLYNSMPHEVIDLEQTQSDADSIRKRYDQLKGHMGFAEAARLAKAEAILSIMAEKPQDSNQC